MYAICEFKLPVKLHVAGMGINKEALKDISLTLISFIKEGQAELVDVFQYETQIMNHNDDEENPPPLDCTFFQVSINLDSHERQDWRTFDTLIKDKVIAELESDELYISTLWHRGREEHLGFVKDYN